MIAAALALVLAATPQAAAQQPAAQTPAAKPSAFAPPPPAPKFDIEPFRFLLGRWHGEGHFGPGGGPVSSEMSFELANRTTLLVRSTEDAPNTYRYVALLSLEKQTNTLLMQMSSSLDGPAAYQSKGWVGDTLVFEPRPGIETGPSTVRFTYVRKGPTVFDLTYEFSFGGKWMLGDRQTFTKLP